MPTRPRARRCSTPPTASPLHQALAAPARRPPPADGLSFVAVEDGRVIGTVRLWPVTAGAGRPALLLGPLAVDPDCRNRGIGAALMRRALRDARRGHKAVLLVGDAPYYGRFGFSAEKTGSLWLPGPYERTGCSATSSSPARSTARAA